MELGRFCLKSVPSPTLPSGPCPRQPGQPPALGNPSLLPSESSQQIHSLQGSQCNTQICRSWFLAQVQTTFVPEICFRVFFAKRACAEPCALVPNTASAKVTVPTWHRAGGLGAPPKHTLGKSGTR